MASFQDLASELSQSVEDALSKFEEVSKEGMTGELSIVRTKLLEAKTRIDQELAKYGVATQTKPMTQQRPIIVAKQAGVPLETPLSPQDMSPSTPSSPAIKSEIESPNPETAIGNESQTS